MSKCGFDPQVYKGAAMGMFHCPECGEMQLAGLPHLSMDDDDYTEFPEDNTDNSRDERNGGT